MAIHIQDNRTDRIVSPRSAGDIAEQAVDAALRLATIHHYGGYALEDGDDDDDPARLADNLLNDFEEALKSPAGGQVVEALRREAGRKTAGPEAPPKERGITPRSPRRIEFFAALVKAVDRRFQNL